MLGLDNPTHIAFLLVLLLLVFGAKRLPELGRSLGSGLRGFKETVSGESDAAQIEPATMAAAPAMATTPAMATAPVQAQETTGVEAA